jgi:hypothetical protein
MGAYVDVASPRLQTTQWILDFAVDEPPSGLNVGGLGVQSERRRLHANVDCSLLADIEPDCYTQRGDPGCYSELSSFNHMPMPTANDDSQCQVAWARGNPGIGRTVPC